MKIAMIGLGKMGINLTQNMLRNNNEVVAYDVSKDNVDKAGEYGAETAYTPEEAINKLTDSPKIVWLMLPAGDITNNAIDQYSDLLGNGDILIDGGNSNYHESLKHNDIVTKKGVKYFDVGTSGGMSGANRDGNFMIGGDDEAAFTKYLEPIFKGIAAKDGYLYTGKAGSGHYLKMVHNGIEYGMMQAMGEGFEVLEGSQFDYDYEAVAKVWNNGSVIRSWLMELAQDAFSKDSNLDAISGVMHSSGEGKWTLQEALDEEISTPVIGLSLMMRYRSMKKDTFSGKVVSALRNEFGGHEMEKSEEN